MRLERRGDFIDIAIGGNIEHVLRVADAVRLAGWIIELAGHDAKDGYKKGGLTMSETGRVGQVQEQSDYLESATQLIGELVEQLEGRLTKILSDPQPTSVDSGKAIPEQSLAPLAGFMRDRTQFLTSQANRLRDIISRIEL